MTNNDVGCKIYKQILDNIENKVDAAIYECSCNTREESH